MALSRQKSEQSAKLNKVLLVMHHANPSISLFLLSQVFRLLIPHALKWDL
jgi:hypothetical protein